MTVNIVHSNDRWDRKVLFRNELERQRISDFKVWDAIHSETTVNANISKAHKQIIQDAKDRGLKEVCITEDDFYFPAQDGFQYFLANKPETYDLYLSGVYVGQERLFATNKQVKQFSGLHFYMVHSRFYDFFLEAEEIQSLDNALSKLAIQGYGKFEVCWPMAAIQHETPSDNQKGVIYKHKDYFTEENVYGLKF